MMPSPELWGTGLLPVPALISFIRSIVSVASAPLDNVNNMLDRLQAVARSLAPQIIPNPDFLSTQAVR